MSGWQGFVLMAVVLLAVLAGMFLGGSRRSTPQEKHVEEKKKLDFSKRLILDIRALLWIVTVGGLVLAAYCIRKGYTGSLPWLSAMVGLPWTAHGTVCAFYINMAKSDHKADGITFEAAKAANFTQTNTPAGNSPAI